MFGVSLTNEVTVYLASLLLLTLVTDLILHLTVFSLIFTYFSISFCFLIFLYLFSLHCLFPKCLILMISFSYYLLIFPLCCSNDLAPDLTAKFLPPNLLFTFITVLFSMKFLYDFYIVHYFTIHSFTIVLFMFSSNITVF